MRSSTYACATTRKRAAIETMACTNQVVIAGEYRGADGVNAAKMEELARAVVKDIGYEQKASTGNC